MSNNRIFYAIHQVGMRPLGSTGSFSALHGVQSVGITTTFNLEQVFELGQLAVYENIEGVPDVEVTMEKVLDGYSPIYLHATQGASAATLVGRSNRRCHVALSIFKDTDESASGAPTSEVEMSGMYVSSVGYNSTTDGNATESVTLVGNNKVWVKSGSGFQFTGAFSGNNDSPMALSGSGGVNRREDVLFNDFTRIPQDIYGISSSGTNNKTNGQYGAHITGFSVNAELGREEIFELGRKAPYFRYVRFPVEVTTEITAVAVSGDLVDAKEEAVNLTDRTIKFQLREGLKLNMGTKNKLSSVGYSGGDAGGDNVELTYTYTNFNDLTVQHPQDPTTALRA